VVEVEDVLRVIFVFERGQPGQLVRRIRATHPFGAFVAERIDILASSERIESGGGTPRQADSCAVFGGVGPATRGDVFNPGASGLVAACRLRDHPPRRSPR
jgi:hypothetical protein